MAKIIDQNKKSLESENKHGITRRIFTKGALSAALAAPLLSNASFVKQASAMDFSGKKLKFMIIQPHAGSIEPLSAAFAELTGAEVEAVSVPFDQIRSQATLDVVSGTNDFDVFEYFYIDLPALAQDNVLADVTDRINADADAIDPDDFLGSIYDNYTLANGKRYGLPYDGDTHVLFYNTELFAKYGLSAPKTWDEYQQVAATITEGEKSNNTYGAVMMGNQSLYIIGASYSNRLFGHGGNYLDADGKPALTSDAAIAAAQALLDAGPHCTPTPLETGFGEAIPQFLGGQAGMIEFWTDLGTWAEDPEQSKIVGKWDVVPMPTGGSNTTNRPALNGGLAFGASAGSKNPDMAWAFIKMAASQKGHLDVLTNNKTGVDPIRKSVMPAYNEFAPKQAAVVEQAIESAQPWPQVPETPKLMQALADELGSMLAGNQSAEDAMKKAQEKWEGILG